MKIVIETTGDTPDAEVTDLLRLMERDRAATAGWMDIETAQYVIPCRVVGVVTAEDSPGDQLVMAVIPLEAQ